MGGKVLPCFGKRSGGISIQLTTMKRSSLTSKDSFKSMLRKGISSCKTMPVLIGPIKQKSTSSAERFPLSSSPLTRQIFNLIEHVWNWMKNWIQEHYWEASYRVDRIPLSQLKRIIWEAWEAVPDSYIQSLYDSWWRRCQAVIDAKGGPTKY